MSVTADDKENRKGRLFLKEYSPEGKYRGPDPQDPRYPPNQEEWDDNWADVTHTASMEGKIYKNLDCPCGFTQKTYQERAWCRCRECNRVLIDVVDRVGGLTGAGEDGEVSGLKKLAERKKNGD